MAKSTSTPEVQIPENLKSSFTGMNSSVAAINKAVASKKVTDENKNVVRMNLMHLDHMLSLDVIKESKVDLSVYNQAVEDAKKFLS